MRATTAGGTADGYHVGRRYFFLGRRLDHAYWYPDYQLRLFRSGRGRFEERRVHEHLLVDGRVAASDIDLMHENLKGISDYVAKLNRYADLDAREILWPSAERKRGSLFGGWPERRRALKDVWLRVRGRCCASSGSSGQARLPRRLRRPRLRRPHRGLHDFLIEAKVAEYRAGFAPEQVR